VPDLVNWPSQGVGRANPDGSLGACTACHARHRFSIAVARQPFTCVQCHLEPDVPAWDVYRESKHGNLFLSDPHADKLDAVPWRVGTDLHVPTCATCHNSLLATPDGDQIVPRTHDFGERLWVRLFGLPYAHSQPKTGKTYAIKNKDGLQLPTAFTGEPASEYLIDEAEQQRRRGLMTGVCRSCHASSWVTGHFDTLDRTVDETNRMTLTATRLMQEAWKRKLADAANPFDESLELKWVKQWVFYASSTRYAAAMSGPDYAAFKNGWWSLTTNLCEMYEKVKTTAEQPHVERPGP
jgi:hydroxylamine dehydrogenase